MKHPVAVEGFTGSMEELAAAIGRMRYDKIAEVLHHLAADITRQAKGDEIAGRKKLAAMLHAHVITLGEAAKEMEAIYKLCEPYMRDE